MNKNIQLVIPMAGLGSRFVAAGYKQLKPLIPIHGIPMISVVVDNLSNVDIGHIVLVCQRETLESVNLRSVLWHFKGNLTVLAVDEITDGPAGSVEIARPALDMNLPLVVANSDQYIDSKLSGFYADLNSGQNQGAILCMNDDDPKWSYARLSSDGLVSEVVEKKVVSNLATCGVYGFAQASLAFEGILAMRRARDTTNNEYYVGPSYNYLVREGARISAINLGRVSDVMHGLGIPEDYEKFIQSEVATRATKGLGEPPQLSKQVD